MSRLEVGHKEGHWVMLQNVHLMPKWCRELDKKLDHFIAEGSHPSFRLFLSADPSRGITIGILERSIKLTNEPPQGLIANLRRAFAFFNKEEFEERDAKVKSILFGLCHFHAIMLERKKFGPLGFNMEYPFALGDLRDSASVLYNYLDNAGTGKIPWDDLRYIFGEIMYGGHIVDDWDRKLCNAYLDFFLTENLLDEADLVPYADGEKNRPELHSPVPGGHERYLDHIECMPAETPALFGMHSNAEINYRTRQCQDLFECLLVLQPRQSSEVAESSEAVSRLSGAEKHCVDILDEIGDVKLPVDDIAGAMADEDRGPYQFVLLQECEYMNILVGEMARSLGELQQGFRGELTMSEQMEQLMHSLCDEKIPPRWQKLAFPSTRPLASWLVNLKERVEQVLDWSADPLTLPKVTEISRLFNPQSFLTAIKQVSCQQQKHELNKLMVVTEVTKRDRSSIETHARDGAYVCGLFLEGARWDSVGACLDDSKPKEIFCKMPVVNCKAALQGDRDEKNLYQCPAYCTMDRRPYYVFTAQLRTKWPPAKWTLAGVAIILDIGVTV
mmetsp:Transcript_19127/g.41245  ORF Transcript_19127/g.41245 Transcript_19127/m.41245 type:complete len:558 (-) Transcript_19127:449-2122(-)